jgi:hypothetical protein
MMTDVLLWIVAIPIIGFLFGLGAGLAGVVLTWLVDRIRDRRFR